MTEPSAPRRRLLRAAVATLPLAACVSAPAVVEADDADVLVLGAGIAGLHAARSLAALGSKVLVLEASARVGGRCHTAREVPGRPEMGAVEIGPSYARVRAQAADLGVALVPRPAGGPSALGGGGTTIAIGERLVAARDWAASPLNRLASPERTLAPPLLMLRYLDAQRPLAELSDWLKPEMARFDQLSLRAYFAQAGASPEALRLLDVTTTARTLDEANTLDQMRRVNFYRWEARAGTTHLVRDGMGALTDAMAAALGSAVHRGHEVVAIETQARRVGITCRNGRRLRARAAICTLPLPLLHRVQVTGEVPALQREAWGAIPYGSVTLVVFAIRTPFWERDGLSPDLWSDGPLERVFHTRPSEQAPLGQLIVFVNGAGCERFAGLAPAAVAAQVQAELERVRPAVAGAVSAVHAFDWAAQPFQRGHVMSFRPGQIGRYAHLLAQPAGALYFAGEHCARQYVGLEGACESAENAVVRLLDDLDRT